MADTYSQIYLHIVFTVKKREYLIDPKWESELYKYITGIVQNKGQKMIAINGMPDHVHLFIGMKPSCCLSDLVREIKKATTEFLRNKKYVPEKFQWQNGYGVFSYGHASVAHVSNYIFNQKEHHKKITFREEYYKLLQLFNIEFNEEKLFEWIS